MTPSLDTLTNLLALKRLSIWFMQTKKKPKLTGFDIVDDNIMLEMRGTFTTADPTQPPSAGLINSMVIVELIDGEIGAELASNRQLSVDWADFSHFVDFENSVFTEDEYDQGDGSEDDFESEGHAHPEDIGIGVVAGWTFGDLAAWGAANEARIAEYGIVPDTWDDTMTTTYSGLSSPRQFLICSMSSVLKY